ncbi:cytochrome P450 82C4-like protein [Tanacetum coccineum]
MEDCTVDGYNVKAGTRLIVNVWKIQRDERVWSDPSKFKPERFTGLEHEHVDLRGQQFVLMPFGSGRRSCPGATFGLHVLHLTLARLVHSFDLGPPGGIPVDMTESPGMTIPKMTPLEFKNNRNTRKSTSLGSTSPTGGKFKSTVVTSTLSSVKSNYVGEGFKTKVTARLSNFTGGSCFTSIAKATKKSAATRNAASILLELPMKVCAAERNLSLRMKLRRKEMREKWYGINGIHGFGLAVSAVNLYLVLLEEITTAGHVRFRTRNIFGFQLALTDIRQYMVQFSAGYSVLRCSTQCLIEDEDFVKRLRSTHNQQYEFGVTWIVQDIRHKFGLFYFYIKFVILSFLHQ